MPKLITSDNPQVHEATLLNTILSVAAFLLAGNALLTFACYGVRHTFAIRLKGKRDRFGLHKVATAGPWQVYYRLGQKDHPLGTLHLDAGELRFGRFVGRSRYGVDSDPYKLFAFVVGHIRRAQELPEWLQVWRSDSCQRCGRELYSEYRTVGIGPVCCEHLGIDARDLLQARTESERIERLREMMYRDHLSSFDRLFAHLTPNSMPVARDYADAIERDAA